MLNAEPKPDYAKPILLRPDISLRKEIKTLASAEKRSLNAQSLVLIEEALAARKEKAEKEKTEKQS